VIYSREDLDEMAHTDIVRKEPEPPSRATQMFPREQIVDFVFSEGAAAIVSPSPAYAGGTVKVTRIAGAPWMKKAEELPTELVMAPEHYNRIMRILEKGIPVEMEVEIRVTFTEDELTDHNVIAEIPGTDLADEVVMLGAHLDAHSGATGAEDNATGAAQVLEAARILSAIGVKPRRTIRFALWGGEEIGHFGSKAYVKKHLGDPKTRQYTPAHGKFAGYFNLDYGAGRIRGIFLMHNILVQPIFDEWIKPFHDLGMTHTVLVPTDDLGSDRKTRLKMTRALFTAIWTFMITSSPSI
jgi:hypothetical protein